MIWQTTRHRVDLSRPRVMGIVNVTPDSFSDGGQMSTAQLAIARCERLLADGADLLDIGGESSRPGAIPVGADEEWQRVAPVLMAALSLGCPVSLDTVKADVMRKATDLGVDIINDIQALRGPGAADVVAASGAGVCLMHMRGEPRSMQQSAPVYVDVVAEVRGFLVERAEALARLGVDPQRIAIDPGIGFGKTVQQNFALLEQLETLCSVGYPVLLGWSRKSSLGVVTDRPVEQRVSASVAAALAAVLKGALIVRVHDVAQTVDALKVWAAAGLPQRQWAGQNKRESTLQQTTG